MDEIEELIKKFKEEIEKRDIKLNSESDITVNLNYNPKEDNYIFLFLLIESPESEKGKWIAFKHPSYTSGEEYRLEEILKELKKEIDKRFGCNLRRGYIEINESDPSNVPGY